MLKRTILMLIFSIPLLVALAAALPASDPAGEKKLQEAIHLMESRGDPARAAALFEEVSRSSDRSLAATALLYLARAQERQGNDRVRATYERIVKDFAGTEAEPRARERLSSLAGNAPALPAYQPLMRNADTLGSMSSDGRSFAMTDWDNNDGDLVVKDVLTGRMQRLFARSREDSDQYVEWASFSPNNTQLAYLFYTDNDDGDYELRVMPNQPRGRAETLLTVKDEIGWVHWASWFPDGRSLLAVISKPSPPRGDGTWQLVRIWLANRRMEVLKSLEWRLQDIDSRLAVSPDGRYVAYSAWATNPKAPRTTPEIKDQFIYVLPVDGSGAETIVAGRSGIHESPLWSTDGERIVFVSDRQVGNEPQSFNLWSVVVQNGKPVGSPSPTVRGIGRVNPMGMTDSAYYYVRSEGGLDVFTAALDPASLKVRGPVARLPESTIDTNRSASWSPDGKAVAFFRPLPRFAELNPAVAAQAVDLVVQRLEGDEFERAYPFSGATVNSKPMWIDNENLLVLAGGNIHRVEVNSGQSRGIPTETHSALPQGITAAALDPGRKTLYLATAVASTRSASILTYDLKVGGAKTIWTYTLPGKAPSPAARIHSLAVSPDGRSLAMTAAAAASNQLIRVDTTGQNAAELASAGNPSVLAWSVDGNNILFSQSGSSRLVQVPRSGGRPEPVGIDGEILGVDVHPDGSRLVFTLSTRNIELWAIDNAQVIFRTAR